MNGLTPTRYHDSQELVPYPTYRCKAKAWVKAGHTHLCRSIADHDGKHKCICGIDWGPEVKA